MKKIIKKSLAVILCILMLSGTFVSFAAEKEKTYFNYGSYVLLGDSIASGWSDIEDIESRFVRVDGSYGAYVADDLMAAGSIDTYHPMACIGFRTVELRYIFEEDFEADRFLYYSIDEELMDTVHAPAMIEAVKNAGLITLNVGGNDWGSFLGWHVFEEMDKISDNSKFLHELEAYLEKGDFGDEVIETVIDIASLCGALPELIKVLPKALNEGLTNYFENWNYLIEDIYALNPDVTLLVIGMFDNAIRSEEDLEKQENAILKLNIGQAIIDFANTPMIEGAKKYGYIYVDTTGTICEEHHPARNHPGGHRYIADKILEALPDATFPYTDISASDFDYVAVSKMYQHGIMSGTSETTFSPDDALTEKALYEAVSKISGTDKASDSDKAVSKFAFAKELMGIEADGFLAKIKSFIFAIRYLLSGGFNFTATVTRREAAKTFTDFMNL